MARILKSIQCWFDSEATRNKSHNAAIKISLIRCLPFIITHLMCLSAFFIGFSRQALLICLISYLARMFAITAFYHRYFSHRSFKTSRVMQFIFATLGASAAQRGPLWWSAHHRLHHKHTDQKEDLHSPKQHGFFWSHIGWFMNEDNFATHKQLISDFYKYPELVFLNRYDTIVPLLYCVILYLIGGWQYLIWGYFISTVILYHATFAINSLSHVYGKKKFNTGDESRNNWWLALITLGEGWHNNHHYWPSSARQGFKFTEIDITYMLLKFLEFLGLINSLRVPPVKVLNEKPHS